MSLVIGTNTMSLAAERAGAAALQQSIERTSREVQPSAPAPQTQSAGLSQVQFGASLESRFQAVINELALGGNLTSANARVVDSDFAQDTSSLTKNQILAQAGIAMTARANSQPQSALAGLNG